jgi:hypothetical protein
LDYKSVLSIVIQLLQTILAERGDKPGQQILGELVSSNERLENLAKKIEEISKQISQEIGSNQNIQNLFINFSSAKFEAFKEVYTSTAVAASMNYLLGKPGHTPILPNTDHVAQAFITNKCPNCGRQLHTIGTWMGCKDCAWPYK